jgi:hypothetical protein
MWPQECHLSLACVSSRDKSSMYTNNHMLILNWKHSVQLWLNGTCQEMLTIPRGQHWGADQQQMFIPSIFSCRNAMVGVEENSQENWGSHCTEYSHCGLLDGGWWQHANFLSFPSLPTFPPAMLPHVLPIGSDLWKSPLQGLWFLPAFPYFLFHITSFVCFIFIPLLGNSEVHMLHYFGFLAVMTRYLVIFFSFINFPGSLFLNSSQTSSHC